MSTMQEDMTGSVSLKDKGEKSLSKPLHEKVKEAITKDDDFLNRIIKALSNPLLLLLAVPLLLFMWGKYEKIVVKEKLQIKKKNASEKLLKKNKKLKKQIKQMSINGSGKPPVALIR